MDKTKTNINHLVQNISDIYTLKHKVCLIRVYDVIIRSQVRYDQINDLKIYWNVKRKREFSNKKLTMPSSLANSLKKNYFSRIGHFSTYMIYDTACE
jgi:hypothetical protein